MNETPTRLEHDAESPISDEALTELALGADRDAPINLDAVPWDINRGFATSALPDWYMPRATASVRGRANRVVVGVVIGGMLLIAAFGLCITSGFLTLA